MTLLLYNTSIQIWLFYYTLIYWVVRMASKTFQIFDLSLVLVAPNIWRLCTCAFQLSIDLLIHINVPLYITFCSLFMSHIQRKNKFYLCTCERAYFESLAVLWWLLSNNCLGLVHTSISVYRYFMGHWHILIGLPRRTISGTQGG